MDYATIYCDLIDNAKTRYTAEYTERHHIIPKSVGGTDEYDNLVRLTIREHWIAHCLLYKMGLFTQIFSLECFIVDSLNPHHRRYKKVKPKRWVRKRLTVARIQLRLLNQKLERIEKQKRNLK